MSKYSKGFRDYSTENIKVYIYMNRWIYLELLKL